MHHGNGSGGDGPGIPPRLHHDYDEASIGIGSTPRFFTLPPFLSFAGPEANSWHTTMLAITRKIENRIHDFPEVDRSILTFVLEGRGAFRPGHLGPRRDPFTQHMNNLFGAKFWRIEHVINGHVFPKERALELFTEAYKNFFRDNPDKARLITQNYRDVYDTAETNVESGLDFNIQEKPELGDHLHDIAIRRALKSLGIEFSGENLLHVRGKDTEGHEFSPGIVKFSVPGISFYSFSNGWWQSGTIEDFYQGTRHVFVKGFGKPHIPPEIWENAPLFAAERLASRFVHQLLPYLTNGAMDLTTASNLPWRLSPHSIPTDRFGRPRRFTNEEIITTLNTFLEIYEFIADSIPGKAAQIKSGLQSAKKSRALIEELMEHGSIKPRRNPNAQRESEQLSAEFTNMNEWTHCLHQFYERLELNDRYVPVILARDGFSISEYIGYRALLRDIDGKKVTVYIPGAPSTIGKKNGRGEDPTIKKLAEMAETLARDVSEEGIVGESANRTFIQRVNSFISADPELKLYCDDLKERILSAVGDSSPIIIFDTFGSGKSALLLKSIIGLEDIEILLGQRNSHPFGSDTPNPFQIDSLIASEQDLFKDLRWPVEFNSTTSQGVNFHFNPSPTVLLRLLYRSIVLYHQALDDHLTPTQS